VEHNHVLRVCLVEECERIEWLCSYFLVFDYAVRKSGAALGVATGQYAKSSNDPLRNDGLNNGTDGNVESEG
jgi:hypothetical protein